jgi:hypothetical protein
MTAHVDALTVTLSNDVRIDDVESLTKAIERLRGVAAVTPHVADKMSEVTARTRLFIDVRQKLFDALEEVRTQTL